MPDESRRRERRQPRNEARAPGDGPREQTPPLSSPTSPGASTRPTLPSDHRLLPPLGGTFDTAVEAGLSDLGLILSPQARAALEAQARLLVAWSDAINLTAHRTAGRIALEHVLDSLTAMEHLRGSRDLIDLGSGAGYPGLPLAVCLPVERCALVDSIGKKARFLEAAAAVAAIELASGTTRAPTVEVLAERAEDLAHDPEHRERWHLVTARALASTRELVELALPLLRVGGRLVAWKRDDGNGALARELADAAAAIEICGGARPEVHRVAVAGLEDHRLVIIDKRHRSPSNVPRSPAERRGPLLG